jgi:hypothetical protein
MEMRPIGRMMAISGVAVSLWWSVVAAASAEKAIDLATFLNQSTPWGQKATVFMRNVNRPNVVRSFDWVSEDSRDEARYPKWANSPEVTLWGMKVWESLAQFENGALIRLKVSLYNKGDVEAKEGPTALLRGQDPIVKLLGTVDSRLERWSGRKGQDMRDEVMGSKGVTTRGRRFLKGAESLVRMTWSYSGRSRDSLMLEYVTLIFEPLTRENDPRIPQLKQRSTVKDPHRPTAKGLAANVTRTVHGDVYIDGFPMVDQGAKGYCAVATAERILRYYGRDVDQHVLAQLAQSSGRRGTNAAAMYEALRKAGARLGVSVRDLQGMAPEISEWTELANDYNRQARREKKPEIENEQWISVGGGAVTYNFGALFEAFDWEVYTNYKLTREEYELKKFRKHVKERIDAGIPLVWSVMLGKVPEPRLPQARGGHMRTIIGYNEKNDEVVYSDSWGPGHEFKKMAMTAAFTITTRLDLLAPRLRR